MDEDGLLVRAAGQGDHAALAALARRTQGDVWRLCAHLVEPAAADDCTQETYLRALRAAPAFRGESSARTWLLGIARRVAADEIRRRGRARRLAERLRPRADAERQPDATDEVALDDLLQRLEDPDQRAAIVLTQVLGCSYAEAAEACGVAVGTIRSRVARGRERLLDSLHDEGEARRA